VELLYGLIEKKIGLETPVSSPIDWPSTGGAPFTGDGK